MKRTFLACLSLLLIPFDASAEDVVWTNAVGVSVSGNDLTMTATSGNAGAVSTKQFPWGPVYVEFTASETTTYRVCGLSKGDANQGPNDIDFGLYLYANTAYPYEAGGWGPSLGTYVTGDKFRVEAEPGIVRYRKNGVVVYTSTKVPVFPLLVDTSMGTNGSTINDVVVGTSVFSRASSVTVAGATVTKTGTVGWNAGAISVGRLETGAGYAQFTATETNTNRALGLNKGDAGTDLADIDYAINVKGDGTYTAVEGGTPQGSSGTYSGGDVFRVEVSGGSVLYKRNGATFYTSLVAPSYPLVADMSLDTVGATLADVKLVGVVWQNATDVSVSESTLTKTGGAGWTGGASSTTSFAGDGYMEFSAQETNTDRVAGLSNGDSSQADSDVDYGIWLKSNGTVGVLEAGVDRGSFPAYANGDRFRVEVADGTVKYRKNGVVFYTSTVAPSFPLLIDTALDELAATVAHVTVGRLVWKSDSGLAVYGTSLQKTADVSTAAGAVTTATLSGDGALEFVAGETNTYRIIGLSNGNPGMTAAEIDFGIWLYSSTAYVEENGVDKYTIGAYARGDRFSIEVVSNVVRYYRNGLLVYTSTVAPTYPLLVDTQMTTQDSTLLNVTLGVPPPPTVQTPTFSPVGGTYTSAQTVQISCATSGAEIRYTTDGGDPTPSSTLYTGVLNVGTTTTLKAKAWKTGYDPSAIASATYQMNFGTAPAPTFSPTPGTYVGSASVTLSSTLTASTVRYTTDGSDPTSSATAYTAPIALTATTTLKARTFHPDYTTSATATGTYTIEAAPPTFTPDGGTYAAGSTITVTGPTGATIRYTLNGVDPVDTDPVIASGGMLVVGNYTLKAKVFKAGCNPSATKSATYTITGVFTPVAVVSGAHHSLALKHDGTVWAWGLGTSGQLGDGTATSSPVPRPVAGLTGVVAIAAGRFFSIAVRQDGTVWAWGDDTYGCLGNGASGPTTSPAPIGLTNVTAVAAGEYHGLARKSDGTVVSWGNNMDGQLGDGTTTTRDVPVTVAGLSGVAAIAAGRSHSLALLTDGSVRAWGDNYYSKVGDGSATDQLSPVAVDGLSGITAIASGGDHSLALRDDGTVWAWGSNWYYLLGDGTGAPPGGVSNHTTPVKSEIQGASAVGAGLTHSMALKGGSLWTWGQSTFGVLANGNFTDDRKVPTAVNGASGIATLGGSQFANPLVVTTDGRILTWGYNVWGAVGDGTYVQRNTLTEISAPALDWKVGTPTFTIDTNPSGALQTFTTPKTVTVGVATAGATIHYTTNGLDPTEADPVIASGGTLVVDVSQTLKARAFKAGMPASNVDGVVFSFKAATPTFSHASNVTQTAPFNLTLACTTTGAVIRYTTDGSEPAGSSAAYTAPIPVSTQTTFKVKAFKSGWSDSDTAVATYNFDLGATGAPVPSPAAGTYVGSVSVALSATTGATIRYTTDGYDPTLGSPLYTAPLILTATTTLKARAWNLDYSQSPVMTAVYTIQATAPVISPAGGSYTYGQNVTISSDVVGGTIRYTLGGADPTANDPAIASGTTLSLVADCVIKARVFKSGLADGATASATYTITGSGPSAGSVGAGTYHSFAARPDGSLWAWGNNGWRQLGDGTTTPAPTPMAVTGFGTVGAARGGANHSLALRTDGKVWAAGLNSSGQLGQGNTSTYTNPVEVLGLTGVTALSARSDHGLVVAGGAARAWGYNNQGQLGDNSTTNRSTPVEPQGLTTGVIAVAAGTSHSLALKSDGTVWAWGDNSQGQLGNNAMPTDSLVPVQVSGITNAVAVAAGGSHSLALLADGTMLAWGWNAYGQLGDGTTAQNRATPVSVAGLAGVRQIAAEEYTSLAARSDGSVVAWGSNLSAEMGIPGVTMSNRALFVAGPTGIVALAGGMSHGLALGRDGTLWGWGYNYYSQVGDGTTLYRYTPVKIAGPALDWVVAMPTISVAAGQYYAEQTVTLNCVSAGALIHYTTSGADPLPTDPSVSPGGTVTVTQSGTLKVRAYKSGVLPSDVAAATYTLWAPTPTFAPGNGTYTADFTSSLSTTGVNGTTIRYTTDGTPVTTSSPLYTAPIPIDRTMTPRAKAWRTGWTDSAEGLGVYVMKVATAVLSPTPGPYSSAQTVTISTTTPGATLRYTLDGTVPTDSSPTVASGGTVVLDTSGTLTVRGFRSGWTSSDVTWASYSISLGGLSTPTISPAAGTYTSVQTVTLSATSGTTIRYTTDGTEPTLASRIYIRPITVDATTTVKAKAFREDYASSATASSAFTITLASTVDPVSFAPLAGRYTTTRTVTLTTATSDATIHYTTNGLDPTTSDPSVASGGTVIVDRHLRLKARAFKTGLTASPIRTGDYQITGAIGAGWQHGCAVKADGSVWCFGNGTNGELGNGTTTSSNTPVQATGLTSAVAVLPAGDNHTLAVKSDGTAWAWGNNTFGKLGDGTTTQRLTPVQVSSLTNVRAVAGGVYHSLALKNDGTVWAWGFNGNGQLGDGSTTQRPTPVPVSGLTDVVAIASGDNHSVALKRDGTVWAWGRNVEYQLGDGTTTGRTSPAQVAGISGVVAIAAGGNHTRALKTDGAAAGTMWAWGANGNQVLGTSDLTKPTKVLSNVVAVAASAGVGLALKPDGAGLGLMAIGNHFGNSILTGYDDGLSASTSYFISLASDNFADVATAALNLGIALKWDTSLFTWGPNRPANGFVLGNAGISGDDPDGDGLTTGQEWALGTDPWAADTNDDGITDGEAVATGRSATEMDIDGDGVSNATERANGTDPFRSDTDNDAVSDSLDCFPLDPARTTCPVPQPGDTTPPTITLTEPTSAVLVP